MISLDVGEKIVKEARKHWYAFVSETTGLVLAGILPFLLWPGILILDAPVKGNYYFFYSLVWFLFLWVILFVAWTNYYLDVLVVTNKRIIDIEQHGLFKHDLAEVRLDKIEDIKVEIKGFLPSLLNFGNITLQTAAAQQEFAIKQIPNPHALKEAIFKQQEELTK